LILYAQAEAQWPRKKVGTVSRIKRAHLTVSLHLAGIGHVAVPHVVTVCHVAHYRADLSSPPKKTRPAPNDWGTGSHSNSPASSSPEIVGTHPNEGSTTFPTPPPEREGRTAKDGRDSDRPRGREAQGLDRRNLNLKGSKAGPRPGFDSCPRVTELGTTKGAPVHGQGSSHALEAPQDVFEAKGRGPRRNPPGEAPSPRILSKGIEIHTTTSWHF
jgi:hypothetical protein